MSRQYNPREKRARAKRLLKRNKKRLKELRQQQLQQKNVAAPANP